MRGSDNGKSCFLVASTFTIVARRARKQEKMDPPMASKSPQSGAPLRQSDGREKGAIEHGGRRTDTALARGHAFMCDNVGLGRIQMTARITTI